MKKVLLLFILICNFCFAEFESDKFSREIENIRNSEKYDIEELNKIKEKYIKEIVEIIKISDYYNDENNKKAIEDFLKADKEWEVFFQNQRELLSTAFYYRAGRIYGMMYDDFEKEMLIKRIETLVDMYDVMNQG